MTLLPLNLATKVQGGGEVLVNCCGGMRRLTAGDLEEQYWDWWGREEGEGEHLGGGGYGCLSRREALVYKSAGRRFPKIGRD